MILSSDELEILDYLKSWKGNFVTMVEICRCAGGRKKFRESPQWARALMSRLVESNLIEVNERGHYRVVGEVDTTSHEFATEFVPKPQPQGPKAATIVGDDYFPAQSSEDEDFSTERWVSPHIAEILKNSGKKFEE